MSDDADAGDELVGWGVLEQEAARSRAADEDDFGSRPSLDRVVSRS
jgi:hypothetical protein